jgi:hypothetical protein
MGVVDETLVVGSHLFPSSLVDQEARGILIGDWGWVNAYVLEEELHLSHHQSFHHNGLGLNESVC